MKILVASHTYIVELNCQKLRVLANLEPKTEVVVIVPQKWKPGGVQNKLIEPQLRLEGNFRLIPIPNFSHNNQALLTFKTEIINILREFKPHIIQVEQGAKSLGYAQLITLNKMLDLKAKNVFFTWWNLPYITKFPISWLEAYNLKNTDGLISGNQDGVDILREHGYRGVAKVLPQLGVDEKLFSPKSQPQLKKELGISADDFVIGFVGRFVQEKGILTLLKATAGLTSNSWKLLLLGRGQLQETIIYEARRRGIEERLILVESVPHDRVPDYINIMDTLVLPSETNYDVKTLTAVGWKEQFGHVLIEAMACKVPVIGSDSGEIPHVISEAGLIFPEGDETALRECIKKLMQRPQLQEELASRGYERVMSDYTNKALATNQLEFYKQLLACVKV
ncbi:MAG: D-inositol-3-phosphate glycosyltransferase [Chroococcopsis gigantea SAG 12.99]|jgi:glycosyltransferase involved in cell wall biosynthesis|nr:hormogonium polysaccharide biosynthesis glycosyltransferase HpsO [Chlorogloea purpurea SAG 13.99]MDV2998433.1 D-inositol-3-phosphate glycosyltransferase [Chroococcopsis gigantea SAG 12.99]